MQRAKVDAWEKHAALQCKKKNVIPKVTHCRGMICFAASWSRPLAIIEGKMNSQVYPGILQDNVAVLFEVIAAKRGLNHYQNQ